MMPGMNSRIDCLGLYVTCVPFQSEGVLPPIENPLHPSSNDNRTDPGLDRSGFKSWLDCFFLVLTLVKLLPATELHSLLYKEGTETLPLRSSSVDGVTWYGSPARRATGLGRGGCRPPRTPLAAPQGLRPNWFYLQTQLQGWFQLCPPDLADPLRCILHLGSVPRTARALASTIYHHAPTWR